MVTSIKMFLSYNNNERVVEIPVVPNELPDIIQELANEGFNTHTTTLTLLGNKKPRTFSLELFLPTKDYDFAKGNGKDVIDLLGYVAEYKIPARIIIVDSLTELLNMAVSMKSYKYRYDTAGNIRASVEFCEYNFISQETASSDDTIEPVFSDLLVYYNGKSTSVKAANIKGHNLVYARGVLNFLGIDVGWNAESKQVIANGTTLGISTSIYDGSAYCYIRDLVSAIGKSVEWNAEDKSVTIK